MSENEKSALKRVLERYGLKSVKSVKTVEEVVKDADLIDITKIDDDLVDEVGRVTDFDNLSKTTQKRIILLGMTIKMAEEGKNGLTLEEVIEATNEFYVELLLEYLVRMKILERRGKWSWRTRKQCEYRLSEGGKRVLKLMKIFEEPGKEGG